MMALEEMKLLSDVLTAIDHIDEHLQYSRDFKKYMASITQRRAVERELEIIGEAINKLLLLNPAIAITYARLMVDLRNKVIHAYDNINHTIIWKIIVKDIPVLETEAKALLGS